MYKRQVLPENAADPWQDVTLRKAVYDRMIKAIRSADRDHIITVEALWRNSVWFILAMSSSIQ